MKYKFLVKHPYIFVGENKKSLKDSEVEQSGHPNHLDLGVSSNDESENDNTENITQLEHGQIILLKIFIKLLLEENDHVRAIAYLKYAKFELEFNKTLNLSTSFSTSGPSSIIVDYFLEKATTCNQLSKILSYINYDAQFFEPYLEGSDRCKDIYHLCLIKTGKNKQAIDFGLKSVINIHDIKNKHEKDRYYKSLDLLNQSTGGPIDKNTSISMQKAGCVNRRYYDNSSIYRVDMGNCSFAQASHLSIWVKSIEKLGSKWLHM